MDHRSFADRDWADAEPDPVPWAWEQRRSLLVAEVRPGDRVLDLGCGAGRFVAALRDAGAEPVGVELAPAALERARRNAYGADLRLAEPDGTLPLEHRAVDLVWCSEVLEHVPDTLYVLTEARRVLRPDGRLLVTTPGHPVLRRTAIALSRFDSHFDPLGGHLRFYTRASLERALHAAGFAAVSATAARGRPPLRGTLVGRAARG